MRESAYRISIHGTHVRSQSALETKAKEIADEEAALADQLVRFDAERLAAFYDEISILPVRPYVSSSLKANAHDLHSLRKNHHRSYKHFCSLEMIFHRPMRRPCD